MIAYFKIIVYFIFHLLLITIGEGLSIFTCIKDAACGKNLVTLI